MFKLDLEKAEEPEIKLLTSVGSLKKQESSRKTSTSALLTTPKPLTVCITINWRILKEMGIPDHLTYLLRNLYAGQEATVRTGHGTTDLFQIGKGVRRGCMLSPCLFNLHAEYIMWNAGLDEAQAGIKIARRNINNLRYADDTTLMAESEEELRSLFEESEKSWLKTQHSKNKDHGIPAHHFMASRRGKWKQWLISFHGLQNHCRWWLQPWNSKTLAPWKESYDQSRQCIKKQRRHFAGKVCIGKAVIFPAVMYRCESWTTKKAECQRIDAFELWCCRDSWESLGPQGDQTSQS